MIGPDIGNVMAGVISKRLGVAESVEAIIQHCAADSPHPAWQRMLSLNYEADAEAIKAWFVRLLIDEPPPATINGLWFGLYESERGSEFYVSGSELFGEDEEWMCRLAWWPEGRYAGSTVHRQLLQLGRQASSDIGWLTSYAICLGHAAASVNALVDHLGPPAISQGKSSLAIAVGHDSGDALLLGVLNQTGMDRRDYGWV